MGTHKSEDTYRSIPQNPFGGANLSLIEQKAREKRFPFVATHLKGKYVNDIRGNQFKSWKVI